MKTIEEIKANCEVIPWDDPRCKHKEHWIWQRAHRGKKGSECRIPVVSAIDYTRDPSGKTVSVQNVKRAIIHLKTKAPIDPRYQPYCTCKVPSCVSQDCTKLMTREQYGRFLRRTEKLVGDVRKVLGAQRRWAGKRKITPEKEQIILTDPRTAEALENELGLDKTTITWVRRGNFKGPRAGMFSGLLR